MQRSLSLAALLLAAALLGSEAFAQSWSRGGSPGWSRAGRRGLPAGTPRHVPRSSADRARQRSVESLQRKTLSTQAESRTRLREMSRDIERRASERARRERGTPGQVAVHEARVRREEALDDLRTEQEQDALDGFWASTFGPETRRVFERSGIDLDRQLRRRAIDSRLEALRATAEAREREPSGLAGPTPDELR